MFHLTLTKCIWDISIFLIYSMIQKDSFSEVLYLIRDQIIHKTSRSNALAPHLHNHTQELFKLDENNLFLFHI